MDAERWTAQGEAGPASRSASLPRAGPPARAGDTREQLTRVVAAFTLAYSLFYIAWRWGWTLNTEALWFSVPLALAETYGLLTAFFLTVTAWRLQHRGVPRVLTGRTVDVFVTTYNEPLGIIRKTALAAREIRYPHETYLLDDGHRDDVRALAEELGIRYLRRAERTHAKAGNLNHGLAHSTGEFILQLDADHVPLPEMIDRMIGFFADERLAFVQSPQDFYNTDAFTYDVNVRQRRIWEDQQLFFRVLQPGKDRLNAAFFVGSCALLRRAALQDVGGFATRTVTEDIETSLLLHARGWRSAFVNESLAFGLAPATARAFHVQHLRWGQGAMQTLRKYRPLTMPGLTLAQRIAYLDSLSTYLGGFQRLILYLAPMVFFATGVFPLRVSGAQFASIFVPYILLQIVSFKMLARGHGSLLLADRYAMAKFFTHVLAVTGYITRKPLHFRVTPKGADSAPLTSAVPQLVVVALTAVTLAWAVYLRTLGVDEEVPGWGSSAFWVNVVFALWNAGVALYIVSLSLTARHRRIEHRNAESLGVTLRVLRADGKLAASDIAVTENLTTSGVALRCMHPVPHDARVELTMPLSTREVRMRGHVVHQTTQVTVHGTVYTVGVEFDNPDRAARDAIELHCAHHAMPLDRQRYQEGALTATGALRRWRYLRTGRRVTVGMPARVISGVPGNSRDLGVGLLEDVSERGGRILLDHPVGEGSLLTLEVPGSPLHARGRVVFVHTLETSLGVRFVAGFETDGVADARRGLTHRWFETVTRLATRYGTLAARYGAAAARYGTSAATQSRRVTEIASRMVREAFERSAALAQRGTSAGAAPGTPAVAATGSGREDSGLSSAADRDSGARIVVPESEGEASTLVPILSSEEAMEEARLALEQHDAAVVETAAEEALAEEPVVGVANERAHVPAVVAEDGAEALAAEPEERWEVDGHFAMPLEVSVGGLFIVSEGGCVEADISTLRALVRGRFAGTLRASESIRVTAGATVRGRLVAPDIVVDEGADVEAELVQGHGGDPAAPSLGSSRGPTAFASR